MVKYVPYPTNFLSDIRLKRIKRDLGLEGTGAVFEINDRLAQQPNFIYPFDDIDILADEIQLSVAKTTVIVSNYNLYKIIESEDGRKFFSPDLIEWLEPL